MKARRPLISRRTRSPRKSPTGGLTEAGREFFNRRGSNLRPPVKVARTKEQMQRKGSFLVRFYSNLQGPLVAEDGGPTRLALAAQAWGEPIPRTKADARRLAAKGRRLLREATRS